MKEKFVASSWKMKKIAIVMTTKVCLRVRRATKPTGIAASAATKPPSGTNQKTP